MSVREFSDPGSIGNEVYRRLRQSLRAERLIVLGADPQLPEDSDIWTGFIQAAEADGEKTVSLESATYDEPLIRQKISAGQLVLVRSQTRQTSHFMQDSFSRRLEQVVKHPVLSISTLRLPTEAQEQDALASLCLDPTQANDGENRLRCLALRAGKKYSRRNLDPKKIWAAIERDGLREYLVFVHR